MPLLSQLLPWGSPLVQHTVDQETRSLSCAQRRGLQSRQKPKLHEAWAYA